MNLAFCSVAVSLGDQASLRSYIKLGPLAGAGPLIKGLRTPLNKSLPCASGRHQPDAERRSEAMIDRNQLDSTLNGPNLRFASIHLANFLAFCLSFCSVAAPLSENGLGRALGRPAQQPSQAPREEGSGGDDEKELQALELNQPIKRALAGGQQHSYRIKLDADQFIEVLVEQDGIDVMAQMMAPDGKQIAQFDSESRKQGEEKFSLVAEAAGNHRLVVRPTLQTSRAGRYEIRIVELHAATDTDRALHEARNLHEEAGRLRGAANYDKALQLFERALAIRERLLRPDHHDVAASLNSLANLYRARGEYAKAEPLYNQALAIREKALGPEHPDVAASLNNLALLYGNRGEYAKAESLHNRALAIKEKALGPEHPDVARSLVNLANLYIRKGEYVEVESLYRRSLDIWEKALGPEHLDVAIALNNLAIFYVDRGAYAKAEPLHNRALAIREKALGPGHPDVATSLQSLANLYRDRDEYAKAEPLYGRALAIREDVLGPNHPDIALTLSNLAVLYRARGEYVKAEPLLRRALTILEKTLGPEHPHVETFLDELAKLYATKGDLAQAITLQARANAVSERNLALNLIGSERQNLAYLALLTKQTNFTLSLHSRLAQNDPQALDLAFTTLLRRKGRGLDVMADTFSILRRRAKLEDQALLDQLA
jgi:tetratricopeptide (TPR) repeat protein